ncbi:importin subunit alpha-4 [Citrus clementina]|uniref:importin subunit alpha-4 n=1 Tax=Citrus clementina TaxID=85681 RepID=UPI0003D705FE|nr:importin subunit alpha-4 [Citrus x clementina]
MPLPPSLDVITNHNRRQLLCRAAREHSSVQPLMRLHFAAESSIKPVIIWAVMEANIILPYPSFCAPLLQHAELEIKEAAWPVLNATYGGSHEHIQFLVSQGCIKPLCDLLVCLDQRIVTVCL